MDEACDDSTFCLQRIDDAYTSTSTMTLKKHHSYYYQVSIVQMDD